MGGVLKDIDKFSSQAKQLLTHALTEISIGENLAPQQFKYMPIIGMGVYELRIKADKQYRAFYITKFEEGIYILHAFIKKTQKTPKKDIDLGIMRFKALLQARTEGV
jgi:phage-related protein